MSDSDDDDLFADDDSGGDTDELIAESKQKAIAKPKKKILKKKGVGNKRKRIPGTCPVLIALWQQLLSFILLVGPPINKI